jgi:molecular chaperone Hsp33
VLQARSSGAVPLLMVECSSARELRGIARYESAQLGELATLSELMPDGVLAITVEPTQGQRYQGIVDLDGADLAACLTNYFQTSEQLATRFWLHADGLRARGLLLQQLPADRLLDADERQENWLHLLTLANTLSAEELLALDNETLLHRLYHEEALRLFEPNALSFRCSCSRERSANALVSLGLEDAENLVAEQGGAVVIDCQFCNERYSFDAADVAQLFAGGGSQAPADTRH